MGGWQKRVKLAGFLADFGGGAAAEEDGWGRFGALDGCFAEWRWSGVCLPARVPGHVATNGDTARRNARASVPSTG